MIGLNTISWLGKICQLRSCFDLTYLFTKFVSGHSMWQLDGNNAKCCRFLLDPNIETIRELSLTSVQLCALNLITASLTKRPHLSAKNLDLCRFENPRWNLILVHRDGWKRQFLHLLLIEDAFSRSSCERYDSMSTISTLGNEPHFGPAAIFVFCKNWRQITWWK